MSKQIAAQLVMKEMEAFRCRKAEIAKEAGVKNELLAKDIKDIAKMILHGKASTGDPITDYFIAAFECIDLEPTLSFRRVQEQMNGKKGQLFLVIQRERKRHVFGGPGHSSESDYHLETEYTVGILSDDKLVLDAKQKKYSLPTEAYIEVSERRVTEKKPGPYLFSMFDGFDKLEKSISAGRDSGLELELLIGCQAVYDYSPNKFVRKPGQRPKDWVCALNAAIRKLGRNIPEAPEEKVAREAEQRETLVLLDGTRDELKGLVKNKASPAKLQKCKDGLRQVFDRAKELGLKGHSLLLLIAVEQDW